MEVDGDRTTDDERMDEDLDQAHGGEGVEGEDYPVGEGDGMMEDSDGDEMMGDEIQDDEEYEVAMEEENIEPIINVQAQPESVDVEPAPVIETPPIPFNSSTTNDDMSRPVISPFPDISSVNGRTILPKPLESPPAPETEMTPVEEEEQPFINAFNGEDNTIDESNPFNNPSTTTETLEIKDQVPSPEPEPVATTEQALDIIQHNPIIDPQTDSVNEMPIPSVPEPQPSTSTLQVGESSKTVRGGSREPTPGEEYYEEDGEEEEEEYEIDANSLPPIILHLPNDQARYLFETYENDPDTLPVWLEGRQAELAEASLSDVWNGIKVECTKEGLAKNGALVICEKQMDLKMNEDDVNLQSITFLELILLHHGCGLPEPVQLYLSWEESRFITRFNAIQTELEAMRKRSESVEAVEPKPAQFHSQESKNVELEVDQSPQSAEKVGQSPKPNEKIPEEYVEEYGEDEYVEEEENKSRQGAYSDDEGEEQYRQKEDERDRRRDQRDVKAQYAESVDGEVNTRDLERAHPNWAAARLKPTDALHFEGPAGKRYLNYKSEGHHHADADAAEQGEQGGQEEQEGEQEEQEEQQQQEVLPSQEARELAERKETEVVGEEGDYADEEQYDEEEKDDDVEEGDEWNDGADTVDQNESSLAQSKDTDTQDEMNDATVPHPISVPKDELEKLRERQAGQRLQQLQHEGLGEKRAIESPLSIDASALPTPYASAVPSVVDGSTQDTKFDSVDTAPLDEVALKEEDSQPQATTIPSETEISTPALSSLTPSGVDGAKALAQDVLGKQRVDAIPEEDESFSVFVDRVNEDDERGELPAPVEGVPAVGIVPDEGYYDDASYEDTKVDNGPDTVPVTPLESHLEEADLEFFDSHGEDDAYGSDDEEGTLEADSTHNPELEFEPTEEETEEAEPTEVDVPSTVSSTGGPISAKRHNENDESESDLDSKRPRTDTRIKRSTGITCETQQAIILSR
ncbi:hypothetical protein L486_06509 [Kwoniella mangroviensis CBS 10435]|uniref:Uncharacterized protein n=1 Tax=Kwoniella mangroviensis CBS 10435 TaxID=1331196 RepID=A0A1B9IJ99_9TREE|nr:hypothetical protein L486_06509 [Kwoniella mangroviensis CBS 10435]